jgi:hypothetical protein
MLKLIPNWKRAHRMLSVQLTTVNAGIVGGWQILPPEWKAVIPQPLMVKAAVVLFVLTIVSRLIDQGSVTDAKPKAAPTPEGDPHV